jgi:hypothetical protein
MQHTALVTLRQYVLWFLNLALVMMLVKVICVCVAAIMIHNVLLAFIATQHTSIILPHPPVANVSLRSWEEIHVLTYTSAKMVIAHKKVFVVTQFVIHLVGHVSLAHLVYALLVMLERLILGVMLAVALFLLKTAAVPMGCVIVLAIAQTPARLAVSNCVAWMF